MPYRQNRFGYANNFYSPVSYSAFPLIAGVGATFPYMANGLNNICNNSYYVPPPLPCDGGIGANTNMAADASLASMAII